MPRSVKITIPMEENMLRVEVLQEEEAMEVSTSNLAHKCTETSINSI